VVAQTDIGVGVAVTTAGMDAASTARWRLADDGVAGSGLGAARARSSCWGVEVMAAAEARKDEVVADVVGSW
jgi:hypothetical protein